MAWEDKVKDAAKRSVNKAQKARSAALAKKSNTRDPAEAAKIKVPSVPNMEDLLKKEMPDKWLPPCWFTWMLYGPMSPNPDEDISFEPSNGPPDAEIGEDGGAGDDGSYDDVDDSVGSDEDEEGGLRTASTSGSGWGKSRSHSSSNPNKENRQKASASTARKGKGKSKSGGGRSAGQSAVKSKRSFKCLSQANEPVSRQAMKEREREERKRARGEKDTAQEQLRLAREGHAQLVAVSRTVGNLAHTLEQASRTERRTTRINELRILEEELKADGRVEEAARVRAEKYHLLLNPDALVGGGGAGGAGTTISGGTDTGATAVGGGAAGAGSAGAGGAAMPSPGGTGTGATVVGGVGASGAGETTSGATGDSLAVDGGGDGGDGVSDDEVEFVVGGEGVSDDEIEVGDGGEGESENEIEVGGGGGEDGAGQGAGAGEGQARTTPRCEQHAVECIIHVGSRVSPDVALQDHSKGL